MHDINEYEPRSTISKKVEQQLENPIMQMVENELRIVCQYLPEYRIILIKVK